MNNLKIIKSNDIKLKDILKKYKKFKYQGKSNSVLYISNNNKFLLKINIPRQELNNIILLNNKLPIKLHKYFVLNYKIYILKNKKIHIKMKYYNNGPLSRELPKLSMYNIQNIILKILKINIYANHKLNIYFNDLHLSNIILYNRYSFKIIDFEKVSNILNKQHLFYKRVNDYILPQLSDSELFKTIIKIFSIYTIKSNKLICISNYKFIKYNEVILKEKNLIKYFNNIIKQYKFKNIHTLDKFLYKHVSQNMNKLFLI